MNFYHHNNPQDRYFHGDNSSNYIHGINHHHHEHHHLHNQHQYNDYRHNNHYSPHFNPQYEYNERHMTHNVQHHTMYHNNSYHHHHVSPHHNHSHYSSSHHHRHHHHHHRHNVQRPQHQILSSKTETLTFAKKVRQAPIFYDTDSEIAQRCTALEKRYEKTMFEEEEKDRLLYYERCDLIREHTLQQQADCDSDDKPVTPSASDYESSDDEEDEEQNDAQDERKHVAFGCMKDTKIRSIWEATRDYVMLDENGTNILENDRNDTMEYGIYNADGIKQQAMMVPDAPSIDGEYIANNATFVTKKKVKKNFHNKKKKKTRRGKRKSKKVLTRQEMDEMKAKELVAYLEMSRNGYINECAV